MKPLVIDVEGPLNGSPFASRCRLSLIGLYDGSTYSLHEIEYSSRPYGEELVKIQQMVDDSDVLIAFNAKYDLHWLRRYGIRFNHKKLWCLQYAEFCISGQTWPYPSLDASCERRGLSRKSNYIWDTYWSKGIDTPDVPWQELCDYNKIDLKIEMELFWAQVEFLKDKPLLKKLIWNGCQDLLVTEEMEWNGLKYDHAKSLSLGDKFLAESQGIDSELAALVDHRYVLWSSPADLSSVLYGGVIKEETREVYEFHYKHGGTAQKLRKVVREHPFPRLVEPLKGSKNTKGFSTDEGTLRKLKAYGKAKQIIALLLRKRELDKKVGTYYHGFPKLAKEMEWENDLLHGQLNHCRAASGRLSSNKPNQQNLEYGVRECIVTRFPLKSTPTTS